VTVLNEVLIPRAILASPGYVAKIDKAANLLAYSSSPPVVDV